MQMDGWTAATPMLIALHGWRQAQLTTMACLPPLECWRESEFVFRPQMAYYQVARVEFTGRLVAVGVDTRGARWMHSFQAIGRWGLARLVD